MSERRAGRILVLRCSECQGIFLGRGDLGRLVEAESDWHAHRSADTAQLPRITSDMTAPPAPARARSYVDSLFKA